MPVAIISIYDVRLDLKVDGVGRSINPCQRQTTSGLS